MYKLTQAGMPEDPSYPPDLKQLGFFIDERSEIRTIKKPHDYYNFWMSNNDRVNESFREAMHVCINAEVNHRMKALGIPPVYLPHLATEKPAGEPCVPIFVTKKEELRKLKRIIVVVNDDFQDLGMWAYRIASKEGGIDAASVVSLAKAMQGSQLSSTVAAMSNVPPPTSPKPPSEEKHDLKESLISKLGANTGLDSPIASKTPVSITDDVPFKVPADWKVPGLVVLNPGQLLYSHRMDKALTKQSWDSQPLESGIHPIRRIHPDFNKIEGHRTVDEHVKSSFENIVNNPEWVAPDANIYVVGIGNGGDAVLRVLNKQWPLYKERVAAIALTDPTPIQEAFSDQDFVAFLRHRARALVSSQEPFSTPVAVPCNTNYPEEVKDRKQASSHPGAPWLEQIEDPAGSGPVLSLISHASDTLVSSISQLAIDSILQSPTGPVKTTPEKSYEWGYHYFPMLSSGERIFGEIIFPFAQYSILAWFETVANTPNYRNPVFHVPEAPPEGPEGADVYEAAKGAPEGD
ncbi:Ribosomal protein S14 [Botryosphaeria dothidea]|uniref:Ribosomal protein S14 n=1 Tax=Botryosphaeria dothidea TaxID=55169 RepID=A0A8H4N449_9PEZI|nr:Ribosomal protein S14 [Botryosphaeria dothidea]